MENLNDLANESPSPDVQQISDTEPDVIYHQVVAGVVHHEETVAAAAAAASSTADSSGFEDDNVRMESIF